MLASFEVEVGSWFETGNMGYIAGVVAVHMAQTEAVDLVGRKVWVEAVEADCRVVQAAGEWRTKGHFADRKPVVRAERKGRRTAAGLGRNYSAGLDDYFARCFVHRLVDLRTFDFAAGHSCRAVVYHDGHDVRLGGQGRMDCSGLEDSDLTSCSVHIRGVKLWNVKSSDRTAKTLKASDRIARPPCGPRSWYLHHHDPAAAASLHIANSRD